LLLKKTRSRLLDVFALLGASLLVVMLGIGSYFFADQYHLNGIWVMLAWISLGFFAGIGWDYRSEFRSVSFCAFFLAWIVLHALIFVLVLGFLSWIYYVFAVPLELFVFYASASMLFGLKPPLRRRQ